jgi:hypothetical protein
MFGIEEYIIIIVFGFMAGFVDAVVGGGGLIQIPALLAFFPQFPIAALFGTNKLAGFSGTVMASIKYTQLTPIRFKLLIPAIIGAALCSFLGAFLVAYFDQSVLAPIILSLLILVLLYTIFGQKKKSQYFQINDTKKQYIASGFIGSILGFYDGFFGPGTGSFLIIAFVSLFGMDFLGASAHAKIINVVTNIAALAFFISSGHIVYTIAIPLAIANVFGAWAGTKTAIKKGDSFIRKFYILVVSALILKFIYELFIVR